MRLSSPSAIIGDMVTTDLEKSIRRVTVLQYTCQRCGHVWIQQTVDSPIPKSCASCRSAIWTKPKRIAESEAE